MTLARYRTGFPERLILASWVQRVAVLVQNCSIFCAIYTYNVIWPSDWTWRWIGCAKDEAGLMEMGLWSGKVTERSESVFGWRYGRVEVEKIAAC